MGEVKTFDPSIEKEEVDRLFRKLRDTRLPEEPIVPDAGDDYGPPIEWIHKLYNKWLNDYSWHEAEKKIKSWNHYTTTIEGLRIHFVQKRADGKGKKPIPLLLVHGWPGSFFEFSRVIDPLTSRSSSSDQTFDVVVPSLPGFAWSQAPPRGWTVQDTARIFDTLMKRIGYTKYVAQGGDWGHWIVRELGAKFHKSCVALHTNRCPSAPPAGSELTEREKWAEKQQKWWVGEPGAEWHLGYAIEMRTRPQTIGVAFSDNPVGIMMWVGEKYLELVDPKYRSLDEEGFVNDVLTTLCIYFFTPPSIMTSMLCYYNNVRHEKFVEFNMREENWIRAPFGFTSYKWDSSPTSQRAVATTGNCVWYKERDFGGHFCALEAPDAFVEDMRDFFPKYFPES